MRNKLLLLREFAILVIAVWIFRSMGIAGFLDGGYFLTVLSTSILLALLIRKFSLRGIAFVIEYTALAMGFLSSAYNTVCLYQQIGERVLTLLPFCVLSLFYGLCLSTLNGMLIKKRRSMKEKLEREREDEHE